MLHYTDIVKKLVFNFYVDDSIVKKLVLNLYVDYSSNNFDTIETAIEFYEKSKYSLKEANYELQKWATNNFELKKFVNSNESSG